MIDDRDWQKIGYGTTRLRVPGGWFVMMFTGGPSKTVFFYPDPEHTWDGSALKDPTPAPQARPTVNVVSPTEPESATEKLASPEDQPVAASDI